MHIIFSLHVIALAGVCSYSNRTKENAPQREPAAQVQTLTPRKGETPKQKSPRRTPRGKSTTSPKGKR